MQIRFRLGEEPVEDNSWDNSTFLPRLNENVLLGRNGKYFWYTIKAVNWVRSDSVVFSLINKRETVEV